MNIEIVKVPEGADADDAVHSAVKELRKLLEKCDAQQPRVLWRQLQTQHDALRKCSFILGSTGVVVLTSPRTLDIMVAEGTVPHVLVDLLRRAHDCAKAGAANSRPVEAQAVQRLLTPLLSCLEVVISGEAARLKSLPDGHKPIASPFSRALIGAQPCAALAAAVASIPESHNPPPPASSHSRTEWDIDMFVQFPPALKAAIGVLYIASKLQHVQLSADALAAHLLPLTCSAAQCHLGLQTAGVATSLIRQLQITAINRLAHHTAWLSEPGQAQRLGDLLPLRDAQLSLAAVFQTPAVPRLLLSALGHWRRAPSDASAAPTRQALHSWCAASAARAARQPGEAADTAMRLSIADICNAIPDAAEARDTVTQAAACRALSFLLQPLPSADRLRAFEAVAAFTVTLMRGALEEVSTPMSDPASSGGDNTSAAASSAAQLQPGLALHRGIHERCAAALLLTHTCLAGSAGTCGPAAMKELQRQRKRARWCLQAGLLAACEHLLRAAAPWPKHHRAAVAAAGSLAALVWGSLRGDAKHGAPALSALHSMLATLRKVVTTMTPPFTLGGGHALRCAAGSLQPFYASVQTVITALQRPAALHHGMPLQDGTAVDARGALQGAVLQLLPSASHLLRHVAEQPGGAYVTSCNLLCALVEAVVELLDGAAGDAAAAAGAPRLLHSALRAAGAWGSDTPQQREDLAKLGRGVLHVLMTAHVMGSWQGGSERLALLDSLEVCLRRCGVLPHTVSGGGALSEASSDAGQGEADPPGPARLALVDAAGAATADDYAKVLETLRGGVVPGVRPPTWDDHLLGVPDTLPTLMPTGEVGASTAAHFVGCCHRGCSNLSGPSEAALRLRRCAGCRLARYCSEACQLRAWRQGHRKACQALCARKPVTAAAASVWHQATEGDALR